MCTPSTMLFWEHILRMLTRYNALKYGRKSANNSGSVGEFFGKLLLFFAVWFWERWNSAENLAGKFQIYVMNFSTLDFLIFKKKRGGISRIFLLFFILFSSSCMLKQFFCPFLPRQKNIDFRNHPHLPNFLALFCKQNQSTIRIVHMQGEMPSI